MSDRERKEASDPTTPQARLSELAKSKRTNIRGLVAKNPNASRSDLVRLFGSFPMNVLQNKAPSYYNISDPGFSWIPWPKRETVAMRTNLPMKVLEVLASCSEEVVRRRVSQNWTATPEVLRTFKDESDYSVILNLVIHPNLPFDMLEGYLSHGDDRVRTSASLHIAIRRIKEAKSWTSIST